MQKIVSYLYPNRIQLLADLVGFITENTVVYQRNIKIYNGVDNIIEFDVKNADQKRVDLSVFKQINLNVMDQSGNSLPNSPYEAALTNMKGICTTIIPQDDLADLDSQFLKYSVTATNIESNNEVLLYCDSRFGAIGTIELVGDAMPTVRDEKVYTEFYGEINFAGTVTSHSSAIAAKFYEAVPTTQMDFGIDMTNFVGTIWIEATRDDTIRVESFKNATRLREFTTLLPTTTSVSFNNVDVGDFSYFRISWQNATYHGSNGTVDKITVM